MGESIPEHHRSRRAANAGRQVVASGSVVVLRVADPVGRYPIGQGRCAIGSREQPVFVQRRTRHGDDLEVDAAHRDRCHAWSAEVTRVGVEQVTSTVGRPSPSHHVGFADRSDRTGDPTLRKQRCGRPRNFEFDGKPLSSAQSGRSDFGTN